MLAFSPPKRASVLTASAAVLIAWLPSAADASTVLTGSGQLFYGYEYLSPNATTPTATGDSYSLGVPGTYTFNNFVNAQGSTLSPLGTSSVGAYDFQDSYVFSVAANASGDTLVASLGLGTLIEATNLQMRLYEVPSVSTVPTVGAIPAGDTTITAWTGVTGVDSSSQTITRSFSGLASGNYILDIAGISSGTAGGTYVGTLNIQPVPLPAAAWLLISSVGGLGVFARKRKAG